MAQAKKKPVTKKLATKKTVKPVSQSTSVAKKSTAAHRHASTNASSALMWALLGVVVIGFTIWVLSQQVAITDTYNSNQEIDSTTVPVTN